MNPQLLELTLLNHRKRRQLTIDFDGEYTLNEHHTTRHDTLDNYKEVTGNIHDIRDLQLLFDHLGSRQRSLALRIEGLRSQVHQAALTAKRRSQGAPTHETWDRDIEYAVWTTAVNTLDVLSQALADGGFHAHHSAD